MTMGTPAFCGTCPYYAPSDGVSDRGYCRRFPPIILAGAGQHQPIVKAEEFWCGEHPERSLAAQQQRQFAAIRAAPGPPLPAKESRAKRRA